MIYTYPLSREKTSPIDGKLILLADDDVDFLVVMEQKLKSLGAYVVSATTTKAAIAVLGQVNPHLIVTDISFDGKNSGYGFLAFLYRSPKHSGIPSLVLSSSDDYRSENKALTLGALAVVKKPLGMPKILDEIMGFF